MSGSETLVADGEDSDRPERSCIVTRTKGTPEDLIRFVLSPDGTVVPDIRAKLPGRGAWVIGRASTVAEAVRRKAFARAFKAEVKASPELPALIDALLEKDALQALSLANKAGLVVAGMTKVESLLAKRPVAAVIHAADGSQDGRRKLEAAIRGRLGEAAGEIPRVQIFASGQLDLALGRTNVIHAALAVGSASQGFVSRSQRLDRFRCEAQAAEAAAGTARSIEE